MSEYRTIVVPFDFSEHARAALYTAADLAKHLRANLRLVHAIHAPTYAYGYGAYTGDAAPVGLDLSDVRKRAAADLSEVASGLGDHPGMIETHVVEGTRIDVVIREFAEEFGADLIVMGTHGRTGLAHVFLGSVAERTLRTAPCPVLTVRVSESAEGGSQKIERR